jgi:glycosyltransferase involved in cell wall biosynthesis
MTAMKREPISAVITTKNNQRTLRRCLNSVGFCEEILVLDSYSDDNTLSIAKQFDARIVQEEFKGYALQKQSAIDHATHDWVLLLDADEFIDEEAARLIETAVAFQLAEGFYLSRREWLLWRWPHARTRPNWMLRLFNRRYASMSDEPVHAEPKVRGRTQRIALGFYHQGEPDLASRVGKINAYSSGMAEDIQSRLPALLSLRVIIYSHWVFWRFYLGKRYFLNGWAGYLAARTAEFYAFLKYAKVIELQQRATSADAKTPAACDTDHSDEVPR